MNPAPKVTLKCSRCQRVLGRYVWQRLMNTRAPVMRWTAAATPNGHDRGWLVPCRCGLTHAVPLDLSRAAAGRALERGHREIWAGLPGYGEPTC